jgi:hypothetical protein
MPQENKEKPSSLSPNALQPTRLSSQESAVDEYADEDDGFVDMFRAMAEVKVHHKASPLSRAVPFHFSPNFLPLTPSNWEACVALENAAFTNPEHRCSPAKVNRSTWSRSWILQKLYTNP